MTHHAILATAVLLAAPWSHAASIQSAASEADQAFKLGRIPPPASNDAAHGATVTVVDGQRDGNGAQASALTDGRVPFDPDEPGRNFFFTGKGGRIGIDLGKPLAVKALRSYSWHPRARGPQVYQLYAAKGDEAGFNPAPKRGTDPLTCGWAAIAKVDTRRKGGGQHAVAITAKDSGTLGEYQHLLLDVEPCDADNPQSNTFFSEIDVVDANGPALKPVPGRVLKVYRSPDRRYTYELDATVAPDLVKWVEDELMPVVYQWYPKMVGLLPSEDYTAPQTVRMEFRDDMGGTPAYAAGNKLSMSAPWFRTQLKGEAKGCVIHELVHVVQNYWIARSKNPNPARTPGWVVEGIPDYVRWFLYEPESKGAEITRGNIGRVKYDDSYRTSANFLHWVVETHDKEIVRKLNAAAREGRYSDELWKQATGRTIEELGADWKAHHAKRLGL